MKYEILHSKGTIICPCEERLLNEEKTKRTQPAIHQIGLIARITHFKSDTSHMFNKWDDYLNSSQKKTASSQ